MYKNVIIGVLLLLLGVVFVNANNAYTTLYDVHVSDLATISKLEQKAESYLQLAEKATLLAKDFQSQLGECQKKPKKTYCHIRFFDKE